MLAMAGQGAIIEFVAVGNSVKVSAIDERTGIEVSVICPKTATKQSMQELALKKLQRMLKKRSS